MSRTRLGSQGGTDVWRDDATGAITYEPRVKADPVVHREEDIRVPAMNRPSPERLEAEREAKAAMDERFRKFEEREAIISAAARKRIIEERGEARVAREVERLTGQRP